MALQFDEDVSIPESLAQMLDALLHDGATKLAGHRLDGRDTSAFATAVARCLAEIWALGAAAPARFDWSRVPRFPAED